MLQKKRRYLFRWLTPKANVIQNEWEWKWCAHTHNLCTKRDMANEKENREDANGIIGLMHRSIDLMKNKQYQFEATRLINFDHYWLNDRKSEFICKWMFANIFSSAYVMLQLGYCTFFFHWPPYIGFTYRFSMLFVQVSDQVMALLAVNNFIFKKNWMILA